VLGVAIILIFVWGLFSVGRFIFQLVAAPIASHAGPLLSFLKTTVVDHLDGWVTGIATCFLAYFTVTLRAEARRQAEKDRPFLAIDMEQDAHDGDWNEPYPFRAEDDADNNLPAYQNGIAPLFVRTRITNEQTTVTGIATNVELEFDLQFGVNDNVTRYPYILPRKVSIPVIGSNKYTEGALFNVAGLPNYTIRLTSVSYKDLSGKMRRFGHGVGSIYKRVGEDPSYAIMVLDFGGGKK